jgi:FAD:protein FMN transferase
MATDNSASWPALGTRASLLVDQEAVLAEARSIVEDHLDQIDRACSRFRPDSELSEIARRSAGWVSVSPLCLTAVEAGLRAARLTDGAVDPTLGRSLQLVGYDRDLTDVLDRPRHRVRFMAAPGWQVVDINRHRPAVRVPRGVELDLGATAKALAADRAAREVSDRLRCGVVVNLGGDIAVAGPPPAGGWAVRVTEDHAAGFSAPGQTIAVSGGGLATSSTTVRRWTGPGGDLHHVLDPATGRPAAEVWRSVSVAAGSCLDANTATTAAIVYGERAPKWLEERGLPARLTAADGSVVRLGGWPREESG